jgi:undecaprenyl-diphosphatase
VLEKIIEWDKAAFLALNGMHHVALDRMMWFISQMATWTPVYLLLLYFLYKKYPAKSFLYVIGAIALTLFFTDFIAATFVKETVQRLRPGHEPSIQGWVHHVMDTQGHLYKGGSYGFFSNHASNFFGVVTLYLSLMKPVRKWIVGLLYAWALLIVYSRIYLGVHYPGDILVGAVYGMLIAWLVSKLFYKVIPTHTDKV